MLLLTEVTAVVDPTSNVMTITAKSGDAAEAQAAANAFAQAYIASSYKSALGNLVAAVKSIQPRLDRMQTQIASLDTQILAAAKAKGNGANVGALTAQRRHGATAQYVALFGVQESLRTQIQLTRPQAQLVSAGRPSRHADLTQAAEGGAARRHGRSAHRSRDRAVAGEVRRQDEHGRGDRGDHRPPAHRPDPQGRGGRHRVSQFLRIDSANNR